MRQFYEKVSFLGYLIFYFLDIFLIYRKKTFKDKIIFYVYNIENGKQELFAK